MNFFNAFISIIGKINILAWPTLNIIKAVNIFIIYLMLCAILGTSNKNEKIIKLLNNIHKF